MKDEVSEFVLMLNECEADPASKEDPAREKIAKARHILDELRNYFTKIVKEPLT